MLRYVQIHKIVLYSYLNVIVFIISAMTSVFELKSYSDQM